MSPIGAQRSFDFGDTVLASSLVFDPDGHTRLKACGIFLRVEAQAKRVAIMIPDDAFGLPGRERSERPQFGDGALDRAGSAISHHARGFSHRETIEMILADIEREPLPSRGFDHQDWLA